jgi:hypothetical protein
MEELIPLPHEAFAVGGDDAPETFGLSRSVPPIVAKTDRAKPEDRPSMCRLDMDVGWLVRTPILVREEPARPSGLQSPVRLIHLEAKTTVSVPASTGEMPSLVGLIGHPVAGNPTGPMLEATFAHHGLDWRYVSMDVLPEQLAPAVAGLAALGFRGFHVTVPHKVAVVGLRPPLVAEPWR